MCYDIIFEKQAIVDIEKINKSGDTKSKNKLKSILDDLEIHPKTGTGNPEQLKYNLSGLWSRRINKKDRLIYEIIEEPDNMQVLEVWVQREG